MEYPYINNLNLLSSNVGFSVVFTKRCANMAAYVLAIRRSHLMEGPQTYYQVPSCIAETIFNEMQ